MVRALVKFSYCGKVCEYELEKVSSKKVSSELELDIATLPIISSYEEVECNLKERWIVFHGIKMVSNSQLIEAIDYYFRTILSEGELNVDDFIGSFLPDIRRDYARIVHIYDEKVSENPFMNYVYNQLCPWYLYNEGYHPYRFLSFVDNGDYPELHFGQSRVNVSIVPQEGVAFNSEIFAGLLLKDFEPLSYIEQDEEIYHIKLIKEYEPENISNAIIEHINRFIC
jgi:hypothetical protein